MIKILFAVLSSAFLVVSVDYHVTLDKKLDFANMSSSDLQTFVNCYLDKGPCTDIINSYKQHYPSVMREKCARCTLCHKYQLLVFLNRLRDELPEEDRQLRAKFDPDNKFYDKLYNYVSGADPSYCET